MLMMVVDALLSRVIARGPTVLVVDDVQWADPATWDALSYLVAGFGRQRLALVTTHRDEAAVSDQFQHWLGNVRRLPGTEELVLTRLDQDATGDQIAELLGRPPPPRLVEQVYERSRGNPYFSELLVRRGDLDSAELPDDLPDELSQALLDAWRGLSGPAREIARILAIAGRPTDLRTLAAIAAELGVSQAGSVREAVDAGVVVLGGDGVWFRHPLLAGVLAETYLPGEAAPVHAAWAAHLESVSTEGVDELRRLGDLASHHERAGDGVCGVRRPPPGCRPRREARRASRGRRPAGPGGRPVGGGCRRHRRRGPSAAAGARRALPASGSGGCRDGYRLFRAARDLVSAERDPLWASRLTARLATVAFNIGETRTIPLAEIERAVELSRRRARQPRARRGPDCLCRAPCSGPGGTRRRVGWSRTRWRPPIARAQPPQSAGPMASVSCLVLDTDLRQADLDATACWEQAFASGEPEAIGDAYGIRHVISCCHGRPAPPPRACARNVRVVRSLRETVLPSVILADVLLAMGELVDAEGIVRSGLAATGSANGEANIRLHAGVLAVRRGDSDTARGHLTRAREIMPYIEERPECMAGPPIAEMLLAQDDPAGAFELIERVLPLNTVDPRVLDELMVLGARAAADLVQRASDDRDQAAVRAHREALIGLVKTRATLPGIAFQPSCADDTVQPARAALFAAEVGRAEGVEDQVRLWREAVAACAAAALGWEQQVSSWRLASALVESGASGTEAAELLRGVHDYASPAGRGSAEGQGRGARRECPHLAGRATAARCRGRTRRLHRADRPGDRGARPPRGEPDQRRDRRGALHQREDGERARLEPAPQDRDRVTPRGRRTGPTRGVGHRRIGAHGAAPSRPQRLGQASVRCRPTSTTARMSGSPPRTSCCGPEGEPRSPGKERWGLSSQHC